MRKSHQPATIYYGGVRYQLTPEQWERLRPQIKGVPARECVSVGRQFLINEGLIKLSEEEVRP